MTIPSEPSPPAPLGPTGVPAPGAAPSGSAAYKPDSGGSGSPLRDFFANMLGPSATPKDIDMAINNMMRAISDEIKKEQKRALETIRKMREDE